MRTYNILYHSKFDISDLISENNLDNNRRYLVRIHTSVQLPDQALAIAAEVSEFLPNSEIIGVSVFAVIYNSVVHDGECMISISDFEETEFTVSQLSLNEKTADSLADENIALLEGRNAKAMIAFFSRIFLDAHFFIEKINTKFPEIVMSGGIAGSTPESNNISFVFNKTSVFFDSMICVILSGERLSAYGNVITSYETIGDIHTMTNVKGCELLNIDSENAVTWFKEFFGKDDLGGSAKSINDMANSVFFKFPLILEDHNNASRFVMYSYDGDKIMNCYRLPKNAKFRMGYLSPIVSVLGCKQICSELEYTPVESLFVYSCVLKRISMHNSASWELMPFSKTDISGAFLIGEIGNVNDTNEFFNGICSVIGFSENESFVEIDQKAFEKMENFQDDNREILSYVLKMQNESILQKNKMLSQQIIAQEKVTIRKVFIDEQSGLYEITKFFFDNEDNRYNKLCMISIEKGDVLRSYYGSNKFSAVMSESLRLALDFFGETDFYFYLYNSSTFVIAARTYYDRRKFQKLVRMFYLKHGSFYVNALNVTCLNNVSVVLDEYEGLIEKASSTMIEASKNGQRYRVYKSVLQSSSKIEEEMKWVDVISDAISNNRVVPFFQPIYNNKTFKVDKFEALMRIIGRNGEVFMPGQFMNIAKDYKMYTQISSQMLTKVFNLFSNRNEVVSVNISAYDINSEEMKKNIYERISHLQNPQNFIFEIVESEELQNYELMFDFVKIVSAHNIKIAIDDFGSGYSNLVEIAKLNPDYIKIDGEIIRNINSSEIHKCIAETVVYMADKLNVSLIAEYVESCDLQKAVVDHRIDYSQGYLFSKPIPYEKIDKYLDSFL